MRRLEAIGGKAGLADFSHLDLKKMKGVFFLHIKRWKLKQFIENYKTTRWIGLKPVYHVRIANAHIFYFFCFEIVIWANWAKPYVMTYGEAHCRETNLNMTRFLYEVRGEGGAIVYSYRFG